jgi:hypothetical protein
MDVGATAGADAGVCDFGCTAAVVVGDRRAFANVIAPVAMTTTSTARLRFDEVGMVGMM